MELSWLMRIRIILAFAIGVVLVGIVPWQRIEPVANGVFAFFNGQISLSDIITCGVLSFVAGFLASLICTPYGSQIGILVAPAGMVVWSYRSADISSVFQASPDVSSRLAIYSALKYESFIWLALAACGFLGALIADKILRRKTIDLPDKFDVPVKLHPLVAIGLAIFGTVLIASILINILAANISYPDKQLGGVIGQPANLQIAFAVIIAFMACSYVTKLFLGTNYVWPALATAPLTLYSIMIYVRKPIIEHLAGAWPAAFFTKTSLSVLPVQMVAFGCIGAVWGYWLAVRFKIWRQLES